MAQESELHRLEKFVEKLLAGFAKLKAEKSELLQKMQEREQQIDELRDMLSSRDMERGEISRRVGRLVEQIEEWETDFEEIQEEPLENQHSSQDEATIEEDLLAEDDETIEEMESSKKTAEGKAAVHTRTGDEGRVQHNLFSMPSS